MKHFVVVGGGTAGWLAAMIISETARQQNLPLKLSVIESSKLPIIGVGEATTVAFSFLLRHFGIDPIEFLRQTRGSIKLGIRHKDWRRVGHTYHGPIDEPHQMVKGAGDSQFLNIHEIAEGRPVAGLHLFDTMMQRDLSPYGRKPNGELIPVSPYFFAYHFDTTIVGRYLRGLTHGVEVIDALVKGVEKDQAGNIANLVLDDGRKLAADFFIDCTGFRRQLIEKELGARWISYGEELPVNRAMPFWLEHKPGAPVAPYTLAWAQSAGWIWFIPTQDRFGCGYVYSDQFLTPEQAKAEVERTLGREIEVRNDIRMSVGRLATPWLKNCLSTGLATGFLEPLESTSIHGTIVQMMLFCTDYLKFPFAPGEKEIADYNRRVGRQIDDFRTFVNCHYVTERDDTPFWRHVRERCIHPETRERLAAFRAHMPKRADFPDYLSGLPHTETTLYYPVLDGLGHLPRAVAQREMAANPTLNQRAAEISAGMRGEFSRVAGLAISHRELLDELSRGG
jgi:hypothetical protein